MMEAPNEKSDLRPSAVASGDDKRAASGHWPRRSVDRPTSRRMGGGRTRRLAIGPPAHPADRALALRFGQSLCEPKESVMRYFVSYAAHRHGGGGFFGNVIV